MKFKSYSFKELLSNIVDNRGKTCPVGDTGLPLIATNCIKQHSLYPVFEKVRYVSDETYNNWFRGHPQPGDMIFVCKGSPGRVNWVPDPVNFCIAQDMVAIRADTTKVYPKYLFALLRSQTSQQKILNMHVGSLIPHFKKGDFGNLYFELPEDLEYQKKVGDAYFDFCLKIESNTQTNQTLEQMAQAIFKSWFVDFDPVKAKMNGEQPEGMDAVTASLFPEKLVESELGLIPEGWEVGDLSDLMDFNPKRTLKKGTIAPYLDMKNMPTSGHLALDIYDREMGSGTKFKNGDSLLARITPCLENGKTAYVDFLEDEQVGWGSTEYIVMRSKSDSYKYFSYYMARFEPFRKFAIQSMTGTSGRQRAQAQTVQTMPFAIPPISILEKFDEFVAPNMQMIKSHGSENRTLAALRDTLLPKLLSGEIDLAETTI
ncbi:restriction endonuclease subunit S [Shewanella sp. JNE10-2]|uniref:restriction endonuclease subunit S n=2 Tax=Shewanella TaxID=22 RepID=UPI0020057B19|nr:MULTISPECIES: restriction endonuclease subunit S [unclassified Shewanella]MCK7632219.1 restriction endonuclease subunit S [Shewanella sp. JNE9-1]MCK7647387.1 restriction endonuclease subunit S [Shewanella sp. JNE3-1]MCK7655528.1 restriction endonuclease subunit S [Shewanella sp. JNE4-1]UPO28060.1 restriction endonuclease subunit S [Shewanella sp. JNE10-2]UPO35267.1 restriction endonuclease subunit S [Shewanella sp. JNE7]